MDPNSSRLSGRNVSHISNLRQIYFFNGQEVFEKYHLNQQAVVNLLARFSGAKSSLEIVNQESFLKRRSNFMGQELKIGINGPSFDSVPSNMPLTPVEDDLNKPPSSFENTLHRALVSALNVSVKMFRHEHYFFGVKINDSWTGWF